MYTFANLQIKFSHLFNHTIQLLYCTHVWINNLSCLFTLRLLCLVDIKCDDPPIPSNGDFISNGSVVTYMCEEGYVLNGNHQRFCNMATMMWNGSDPTCEGIIVMVSMTMSNKMCLFSDMWIPPTQFTMFK